MPNRPTVPNDIRNENIMRAWYQALQTSIEDLSNERISVKDYGAFGNGVHDDTTAFNSAITAAVAQSSVLWIPSGNYVITSTITLADPITIVGDGMSLSLINPFLGTGGGDVFLITSSDVTLMDFGFDGDNTGTVTLTNNEFMIHANPASGTLERLVFKNLKFINFDFSAGVKDVSTEADIRAAYAIKVEDTDRVIIEDCYVKDISGGFVYTTGVNHIDINKNYLQNALLHPICIHDTTNYFNIVGNQFYYTETTGIFLGGFIDVTSASGTQCHHGNIQANMIRGTYNVTDPCISYGAAIRVMSSNDINIEGNFLNGVTEGTLNSDLDFVENYNIKVATYGTSSSDDNGPCKRINIVNNHIYGSRDATNSRTSGILIENDFQTSNLFPAESIKIIGNQLQTGATGVDVLNFGITLSGKSSGIRNVIIEDNTVVTGIENSGANYGVGKGAISIVSTDSTGKCYQIFIGGNKVETLTNSSAIDNSCIVIGQYTSEVFNTKPNYLKGYSYGVVTETGSGPDLWYLDDNYYENSGANTTKFLFNVQPRSKHVNLSGNTASRPVSTDYLTNYMTYFDTTLGTPIWYNGSAWVGAWGSADSIAETISDQVGTMVTGNTETGITVTYQDADNTLDFVVSDLTVAGDTGSTGMTPGDTLTIAGGTNCTSAMSGDTLTLNVDDAFLLNNGDVGTGVYDFGGATSFEIPNGAAPTVDAAGEIAIDTTITDYTGLIKYHDGVEELTVVAMPTANLNTTDNYAVVYDALNNEFTMEAQAGGVGGAPSDAQYVTLATDATLTNERVLTAGTGITLTDAGAGSTVTVTASPGLPCGRLTLATGTPVMTSDDSANTTIYYTPYVGNTIPIYNGTKFDAAVFAELSVATTDTTKNPAAIGASKVNDWFVWNDSGTIRLSHGPDWTSDTVRSAGTALTLVNGIYLNNAAITNGPAASRGTYVGTTRSNASSQLDWIMGGSANDGSPASLFVWNMYNRRIVASQIKDSRASHSYTTASWRAWNNTTGMRVTYVCGLSEDPIQSAFTAVCTTTSNNVPLAGGIGMDSTTALAGSTGYTIFVSVNTNIIGTTADYIGYPGIGVHYVQGIEYGGTNATFYGFSAPAQTAMFTQLTM